MVIDYSFSFLPSELVFRTSKVFKESPVDTEKYHSKHENPGILIP